MEQATRESDKDAATRDEGDDLAPEDVELEEEGDEERPRVEVKRRGTVLALLYLSVFIDFCGTSIVVPAIPYLGRSFGSSEAEIGLLFSGYALSQAFANAAFGRLSDRFGRRRLILVSLLGSSVGFFVQGLARSYGTYLGARLLTGAFAASSPVVQAYVSDISTPKQTPGALALVGATQGLAFLFGPGIGAGLAEFGLHIPMLTSSGVAFFGFLLAFWLIPGLPLAGEAWDAVATPTPATGDAEGGDAAVAASPADVEQGDGEGGKGAAAGAVHARPRSASAVEALASAARDPFQRLIPLVLLASFSGIGSSTAFFTMFGLLVGDKFGYGSRELGFIMSGGAIAFITSQMLLFVFLSKRLGKHFTAFIGSLVLAASIVLLPVPTAPFLTILLVLTHSVGFSLIAPAFPSLLARYAPTEERGRVMGLGQACDAMSRVIVPPILGLLYAGSQQAPFTLCACMAVFSGGVSVATLLLNQRLHEAEKRRKGAALAAARFEQRESREEGAGEPEAADEESEDRRLTAERVFGAGAEAAAAEEAEGAEAGRPAGEKPPAAEAPGDEGEAGAAAEAAAPEHEAEAGRFLVALLRRRGYTALSGSDAASSRRLRGALSRAFPAVRSRAGSMSEGPHLAFSPEMFVEGEEESQIEPITYAVTA